MSDSSLNLFIPDDREQLQGTHALADSNGIMILDFSQIVLSTIFATYDPKDDLSVDLIRHCVINTLRANVFKFKKKYPDVIIAVDGKKLWRREEAWYYKYKRKEGREKSEWDFDFIFSAMNTVMTELRDIFPMHVLDVQGLEADDIIGVVAKIYSPRVPVLIISSDGDFTQCHNKNVRQWSPMQKKWVKSKNGSPQRDLWFKVIKGDKKDGIANIKADSHHYAKDLDPITGKAVRAPSVTSKFLASLIDSDINDMNAVRQKVTKEEFERIEENLKLLDLNNLPQWVDDIVVKEINEYKKPRGQGMYNYCVKNRLSKLITHLGDFL